MIWGPNHAINRDQKEPKKGFPNLDSGRGIPVILTKSKSGEYFIQRNLRGPKKHDLGSKSCNKQRPKRAQIGLLGFEKSR